MNLTSLSSTMTAKRVMASVALVFVASTLAACGASTIDDKSVAKQIVDAQAKKAPDLKVDAGKCPSDIEAKKGAKFKCTVNVAGVKAPYNVTVTKIDGDDVLFDFEPAKPIISTAIAESYVTSQAEADGINGATVDCGDEEVIVQDAKTTFTCTLALGAEQQDVEIEIQDQEGTIAIKP